MSSESEEQLFTGDLYFNGVNGATGQYGLEPMSSAKLASIIKGEKPDKGEEQGERDFKKGMPPGFPCKEGVNPASLKQAGWAVLFPAQMDAGHRAAIKDALSELLALRREQAGDLFKLYEAADGYQPNESKAKFFRRHKIGPGAADPAQMPFYVLLVGSPEEIPYTFQYQLDVMRGVGRIDFGDDYDAYARYARSVVMAESGKVKLPRRAAFFGVKNPADRATQLSSKYLVQPLYGNLQDLTGDDLELEHSWEVEKFVAEQATKAQLARLLGADGQQAPALLFTASHGMEFPLDDKRQIPHQGALLCQDWPGPREWRKRIGQDFYFAGDDIEDDANILGQIALFFACYGAGTPQLDQFARQAGHSDRRQIAPHGFIGALPTRMLRQGALAVLGHVERAWGYSFLLPGGGLDNQAFVTTLRKLFNGDPVGLATDPSFNMRYADMSSELSVALAELQFESDEPYVSDDELTQIWTANNDARGYVVIGDPAVRIPFALPDETPVEERPDLGTISAPTPPPAPGPEAESTPDTAPEPPTIVAMDAEGFAVAYGLGDQFRDLTGSVKKFTDKLATALRDAAEDIMTLEVKTYAVDDLEAVAEGQDSQAKLRALTRIEFDGDMQVFVPVGTGKVNEDLRQIHLEMVREAQANRAQFLGAMAEMATKLLKSLK